MTRANPAHGGSRRVYGHRVDPQFDPSRTLVTIGDIACTAREVITPSGAIPVGSATWTLTDMSRTEQRIPAWAIVLAVLFALCCLLGLLFLLAREERTEGSAQVTVHGPGLLHVTQVPVTSRTKLSHLNAQVNYARSLAHWANG